MKINIFHYHLNPGGVTRIIQSQLESLKKKFPGYEVRVFAGSCPEQDYYARAGAELIEIPGLDYLPDKNYGKEELLGMVRSLKSILTKKIGYDEIIHFHNLNLGKNPVVTLVIHEMAEEGFKVFNHVHDLAEDRPVNLQFLSRVIENNYGADLFRVMYPDYKNVLFGALNSRDLNRISQNNIDSMRLFLLPNPVSLGGTREVPADEAKKNIIQKLGLQSSKKIVTYPVRVIRRKNIGEFILLCTLLKQEAHWLVTLAPQNPVEIEPYEAWKGFCAGHGIPVHFEVGKQVDFVGLLTASDFCITTSMMEGFGMVYMEPWLMNTPVIGRKLDYITNDLEEAGIRFPVLYDRLIIPGFQEDFKDLDDKIQKEIILRALNNTQGFRDELVKENTWINGMLEPVSMEVIKENIGNIRKEFSLEKYAERLNEAYHRFTE